MRALFMTAASALALTSAACAPRVDYAHRTALDCPDRQGELERTAISADRKTCTYRAGSGVDITLQLTPVNGSAEQTLAAIETSLVTPAPGQPAATSAAPGPQPPPGPPPTPAAAAAAKVAEQAAADAKGSGAADEDWNTGSDHGDKTVIDHNGKHVVVAGDEDAHIDLPGLQIDADKGSANVKIGGIRIDANDNEATVHIERDVRLRGEAFSRERRGVRATFIAKRENLPGGYRYVGYQASGPKTGPLSVAMVRSRDEIDNGDHLYKDILRLVRRNGGA